MAPSPLRHPLSLLQAGRTHPPNRSPSATRRAGRPSTTPRMAPRRRARRRSTAHLSPSPQAARFSKRSPSRPGSRSLPWPPRRTFSHSRWQQRPFLLRRYQSQRPQRELSSTTPPTAQPPQHPPPNTPAPSPSPPVRCSSSLPLLRATTHPQSGRSPSLSNKGIDGAPFFAEGAPSTHPLYCSQDFY